MNNNLYTGTNFIPNQNIIHNYVEDYLKRKIGKKIEAHVSFSDSIEWRDSIFNGILDDVGKDYISIKNNQNTFLIWNIYLNYIVFPNS